MADRALVRWPSGRASAGPRLDAKLEAQSGRQPSMNRSLDRASHMPLRYPDNLGHTTQGV